MSRTYSDDEYADALEGKDWRRERLLRRMKPFFDGVHRMINARASQEHRNHVHAAVYAPGGYVGGAGTEGG